MMAKLNNKDRLNNLGTSSWKVYSNIGIYYGHILLSHGKE